jgi:hypothetical protein
MMNGPCYEILAMKILVADRKGERGAALAAALRAQDDGFVITLLQPGENLLDAVARIDPAQDVRFTVLPPAEILGGLAAGAAAIVAQIIVIAGFGFIWLHGITSYHEVLALGISRSRRTWIRRYLTFC